MTKLWKYLIIGVLILLLIAIRAFENVLFYDPFIEFFKYDYLLAKIPDYDGIWLLLHHFYRYGLNAIISLGILYVAFESLPVVRFSAILYAIAFVVLAGTYFYLINYDLQRDYLLTFYVRRLLIQPIFVLVLLPAFYYQRKIKEKPL